MTSTSDDNAAPPWPLRRFWKWIFGVAVGAVTAAILQGLTGGITSSWTTFWDFVTGKQPVRVVVNEISFARESLRPDYVLTLSPEMIPPPPRDQFDFPEVDRWASRVGAIDANSTAVQITVTGRSDEPVILTSLRIAVIERRRPVKGINVTLPTAGPIPVRGFDVNLDARPPTIRPRVDDAELLEENQPATFPFKVSTSEPEVLYVVASTERCDCTWRAELFWIAGEEQGSTIIDDDGEPLRTTSSRRAIPYHMWQGELFPARQPE